MVFHHGLTLLSVTPTMIFVVDVGHDPKANFCRRDLVVP